jgi:hypothetical protein
MASRKKDQRVNVAGVERTKRMKPPIRFVEPPVDAKSRQALIAELAYFRALNRSFEPGHEVEDWLAAEEEIEKRQGV